MIEAGVEALGMIFSPGFFGYLCLGVLLGLGVGLIPGLGGLVGLSIILPFLFGMEPMNGLALLVGAIAVDATSDCFPSVLMGVPGTAAAQATIMDGYPLARQGRAKEALAASISSAMLGGIFGAIILLGLLAVIRPVLLSMASPQLFMLTLLGMSMVGVLSRKSPLVGLLAAMLGALIALTGLAPIDGFPRFTFGTAYLIDGYPLAMIAIGLFGVPEMINLLSKDTTVAQNGKLTGSVMSGVAATFKHWRLVLQGSVVGMVVGILPGLGGSVVDWLAYGVAQRTVKDGHKFGTGDIRGVIAPDSAANAKDAGAFLPTLAFGIPGSGIMAIVIGGLTILGFQVGPSMLSTQLSTSISLSWALALANILGGVVCLLFIRPMSRVTVVKPTQLMPFVMVVIVVASYQGSGRNGDFYALIGFGILGWVMNHVGIPRPPLLLGFVLVASSERYLHIARSTSGLTWLTDPIVIGIAILILVVVVSGFWQDRRGSRSTPSGDDQADEGSSADVPSSHDLGR